MPDNGTSFLREVDFPFHVDFLDAATDELVRTLTIDGPGQVTIPGRDELGVPVDVRMRFPGGRWVRTNHDGETTHGRA